LKRAACISRREHRCAPPRHDRTGTGSGSSFRRATTRPGATRENTLSRQRIRRGRRHSMRDERSGRNPHPRRPKIGHVAPHETDARPSRSATIRSVANCASERSKLTTLAPAAARIGTCCPPPRPGTARPCRADHRTAPRDRAGRRQDDLPVISSSARDRGAVDRDRPFVALLRLSIPGLAVAFENVHVRPYSTIQTPRAIIAAIRMRSATPASSICRTLRSVRSVPASTTGGWPCLTAGRQAMNLTVG